MKPYRGDQEVEELKEMNAWEGECKYCGDKGMIKMARDPSNAMKLAPDRCQCRLCGQRYFMVIDDLGAFEKRQWSEVDGVPYSLTRNGTPKTLDEAIAMALCTGELKHIPDGLYHAIKDFLSQEFGVAILTSDLKTEFEITKSLKRLFHNITRRDK